MTKKRNKPGKRIQGSQKPKTPVANRESWLSTNGQYLLYGLFLVILMAILLKPVLIDGLTPKGVDVTASIGKSNQIREYNEERGQRALWNPALFGGMPVYHRISAVTPSVDKLLNQLGRVFDNVYIYYLFGALGVMLLMIFLGVSPLAAFIAALIFVLWPHYNALWLEGHYAKFRALMFLPWVLLTFLYFVKEKSVLAAALFALAFGNQIRTQHYQIIFYTGLMVFAVGVGPFVKVLLDRKFLQFSKSTALLFAAVALGIMLAAQPMFLANEYLPYSKRGKTTISLDEPKPEGMKEGQGVTMEYATQWSTHPKELLTWFIPRAFGGMSGEVYDGKEFSRLEGRQVPGYWGSMPFTQSYEYMGIIVLLFGAIGFWLYRRKNIGISLVAFAGFLILLSFGRHFQGFYSIFYDHVPYFNKFRAPMMSVTVTYFIFAVLAGLGLDRILRWRKGEKASGELKVKTLWYVVGGFAALGVLAAMIIPSGGFMKASDNYDPQQLEVIVAIREEFFNRDLFRYFVLLAGVAVVLFLRVKGWINNWAAGGLLVVLLMADLIPIQQRSDKEFFDRSKVARQEFAPTGVDKFLLNDDDIYRIFPVGKGFGDNRWSYYHESIGGYSPIKMSAMEELVENCIYGGWDEQLPLNWNVMKFMNVKYAIIEGNVRHPNLKLVHSDQQSGQLVFEFTEHLPRAFFVKDTIVVPNPYERLRTINSPDFNPAVTAMLNKAEPIEFQAPDSTRIDVLEHNPNLLTVDVYTDKQAILVLSENYYPPGWKHYVNDEQVEAFPVNHNIQAILVPEGHHQIRLEFDPDSYRRNIAFARLSSGIILLVLVYSLVIYYLKKYKSKKKESQI